MIPPREQWCIQIDVTNHCERACSNCTRLLAHCRERFVMTVDEFGNACEALAEFPKQTDPPYGNRRRVVGIMGGEPLMHPEWTKLIDIMVKAFPEQSHRGLWTGRVLTKAQQERLIHPLLGPKPTMTTKPVRAGQGGYLNHNTHPHGGCVHHPILVAIQDVIHDEAAMWKLIDECPLQRQWSSAITPKGFFFCEVAAAFDMAFDGPGGVPVTPGCWRHDLAFYRDQIERWCPRCGMGIPLQSRHDFEMVDDISESNYEALARLKSPRVLRGDVVQYDASAWQPPESWEPLRYLRNR